MCDKGSKVFCYERCDMKAVLENLKQTSILHRKQVLKIKEYINQKYSYLSSTEKASVFANAVHKVVDESVSLFEEKHRMKIKSEVLKSAVAKEVFDINGYDVFEVCSVIKPEGEQELDFFDTLSKWVNQNQNIPVTVEETKELQKIVVELAVSAVVEILEESIIENQLAAESKPLEEMFKVSDELLITVDEENEKNEESFSEVEDEEDFLPVVEGEDILSNPAKIEAILAGGIYNQEYESADEVDFKTELDVELDVELEVKEPIWEEEVIELHQEKVERISGYEIKPPRIEDPLQKGSWHAQLKYIIPFAIVALIIIALLVSAGINALNENKVLNKNKEQTELENSEGINKVVLATPVSVQSMLTMEENLVNYEEGEHLATELKYHSIDKKVIKAYLKGKSSLLANDVYMDQFIQIGMDYNVNPLLLIAITGQEQGFVPEGQEYADQILNNPFNVYGSWKRFNTDFEEACKIAARTVLTSSEGRPEDYDPIKWINNTYAEDTEWNVGVRYFFDEMTSLLED